MGVVVKGAAMAVEVMEEATEAVVKVGEELVVEALVAVAEGGRGRR